MKTAVYYYDKNTKLQTGWRRGFENCGFSCHPVSKKYGEIPKFISNVDLWIVEDPDQNDVEWFRSTNWDGKLVCIVNEYKDIYKYLTKANLWVSTCFSDKKLEQSFSGFPFHYCPMASQDCFAPFHTELYKPYDLSIDPPLKQLIAPDIDVVTIPEFTPQIETLYAATKVNYNHIELRSDCVYLNQKAFDICFTGNFQLCNVPQVSEIFEGKVGYTSISEFNDKVKYYIDHEEERIRMAIKAYEVCIAKHTWTYRMRDLLKKIQLL